MNKLLELESSRHYISLLQENITRMASNSTNCKTWLITIVCALFAIQLANEQLKSYLWIAFIPTILFCILDAYYLGQEKRFRNLENAFIKRIKAGEETDDILYSFEPEKGSWWKFFESGLISPSTWLLYSAVFVVITIIYILI